MLSLLTTALLAAASGAAPADAVDLARLPINTWTELPRRDEAGYTYSRPVYVPPRGQVLHWGAVARGDWHPWFRNDVRAFDVRTARWVSDYRPAAKLPGLLAPPHGKGVYYRGRGEMLPCGTPAPSQVVCGVCWDAKRRQVIYTMPGLMAAYDPAARTWRDLKAQTVLDGRRLPGGPPVYGAGTCCDPVHDEIVLFPHWGARNADLRPVTGRMSGHYRTFVYRFDDNLWHRVGPTFGGAAVRAGRANVIALAGTVSALLDEAWLLRRRPGRRRAETLAKRLLAAAGQAERLSAPAAGKARAAKAAAALEAASADAGRGEMLDALQAGAGALRALEAALEGPLRVEPPTRCGTPLVHDPPNKAIVMFGGHDGLVRTDLGPARHLGGGPGALNDTWLYDLTTRQWRELPCKRRPPPVLWPKMAYDPDSGLVLLVTLDRARSRKDTSRATIWGLDVAGARWSRLYEQAWPWPIGQADGYGWSGPRFEIALDARHKLLLMTQNVREGKRPVERVHVLRLDVGRMKPSPAPAWREPPPVRPIEIPPDDPAWVARLQSLPPNRWVHPKPPRDAPDRGWGNLACDPVRGWVVYFGGGHATYQVNNVDVYVVGANRWVTTAGEHNDWVPPVGWGGTAMGLRGGAHAHHQRNEYVALDGRMYRSMGTVSRRWGAEEGKRKGPRYAWFHDIDRGGVWRQVEIGSVSWPEKVAGTYGRPCVVHPDGRVFGFGGSLEPYDGRFFAGEAYFSVYDVYANTLAIRRVPPPFPGIVYECRPFCTLPQREQVFLFECVARKGRVERRRTWLYDVRANRFTDLKPTRQPPGRPGTVLYLDKQDAVFAAIGRDQQWVYSFRHNTWAPLPLASDSRFAFDPVYTQVVYVAKYGVLVGVGAASRGTAVMRPDLSKIAWR